MSCTDVPKLLTRVLALPDVVSGERQTWAIDALVPDDIYHRCYSLILKLLNDWRNDKLIIIAGVYFLTLTLGQNTPLYGFDKFSGYLLLVTSHVFGIQIGP